MGDHAASSRECPVYKDEKVIQEIRVQEKVSTSVARKILASRKPTVLPKGKYSTVLASPRPTKEAGTQTCDYTFSDTVIRSASPKIARSTSPISITLPKKSLSTSNTSRESKPATRTFKTEPVREDFLWTKDSQYLKSQTSTRNTKNKSKSKRSSPSPERGSSSVAPHSGGRPRPASVSPGRSTAGRLAGHPPAKEAAPLALSQEAAANQEDLMEQDPPPDANSSGAPSQSGPPRPVR